MPIQIRPFNEATDENAPPTPLQDARADTFMDILRARILDQDEGQRKAWLKKIKPVAERKPLPPARPDWLTKVAIPKTPVKPSALTSRPFGSPKKRTHKP